MKFERKSSSLSPNHTSIIARVFPVSWVSKFKKKGGNSESEFAKKDQRGKLDFSTPNSSNWKQGRFYSVDDDDDDDGYWRISFEGRMSTGGMKINPVWYDSDSEFEAEDEFHFRKRDDYRNFNDMVLDVKKMKDKQRIVRKYRGKTLNDRSSRKQRRKKQAEIGAKIVSKSPQKDIFAIESENLDRLNEEFWNLDLSGSRNQHKNSNFDPNSINEDYVLEKQRISVSDWKNLENNNRFHEIKIKTEPRSINGESRTRRLKQMNRSKAYSPRTECKIRAIEEMKKARMKLKKMNDRKVFDSYAVAKSSYNPERDFRDSMVEMIQENGIRRPEELEELLACYLTLNCDEYHDLIIKVFRQVWFELHGACLDAQIFFD